MAAELKVARTTLDNWRKRGHAIAFQKGLRNYIYPVAQFDHYRPLDGIRLVLELFSSPEQAWEWLVTENPHTHEEPPIERLRSGQLDEVVRAAEGALDFA